MRNATGDPVSGSDFLNQEQELKAALHLMENRNSFLLLGIRRTGKSSFLLELARQLKAQNGKIIVELNCQGYTTPLEFYKDLYHNLPKGLQTRLKKLLPDSKTLPGRLIDSITRLRPLLYSISFSSYLLQSL